MSTVYNGQGTLVTPTTGAGIRSAITAVANTTPIQLTVTAHGFNTGDSVEIEGCAVTAANGWWQITSIDANTISLNGTTASGASAIAVGYAIDYELQPAYTIPAQGELADAGVVGAVLEGLANPAPFLYRVAGKFRVYDYFQSSAISPSAVGVGQWLNMSGGSSVPKDGAWHTLCSTDLLSISDAPAGPGPVFGANDMLVLTTTLNLIVQDNVSGEQGTAAVGIYGIGTVRGQVLFGNIVLAGGSTCIVPVSITAALFPGDIPAGQANPTIDLVIQNFNTATNAMSCFAWGPWTMQCIQYRKN